MKSMQAIHTSLKSLIVNTVCITLVYSVLYTLLPILRGTDTALFLAFLAVLLPAFLSTYRLLTPFNAHHVYKFIFWYLLLTLLNSVLFFRIFIIFLVLKN